MLQNIHYELEQCCVQYRMSKRTSKLDEAISNVKKNGCETEDPEEKTFPCKLGVQLR